MEEIGRFVSGAREIQLVDAGIAKELDLQVVVPVEDMREPGASQGQSLGPGLEGGGSEGSQSSIWPSIYPEILRLVEEHRSTIVFVNNRRLAERLALRLNELAEKEVARAHHGSLAREQRVEIEELLKAGQIPCLVATSSLELGIDMGAVDLVIQVESPKSVARGLQRVGRAGHELGAVSKGRIFPKFRADLLESAVVVKRMREGGIEETVIPSNPLDVLAQQIVAISADEEISVDELHELVRGAYPFADLSRAQLENVLDMLAGRYPSDEFAELRPRIIWDRTAGIIRGREGVRRLAVTNAGTIPDRGLFGVHLVDGGGRVGELDEEMVYEARAGQTFLLGASTWRIEEITRDRVLVSPAPGVPGAVPFWKGEGIGRPYELGEAIGKASRELVALGEDAALKRLRTEHLLDERAARNLLTFLSEQAAATGTVPSDRTIVVERFRDEIGDWRLCILSPFGARVHAPWALALAARLRESLGIEVQSIWSDDGIALHLPDADAPPPTDAIMIPPDEIEELVVNEVGQSALFGARFRENAARALLIPRRRPDQRTPLWQQRLKAQGLLQVARRYGSFPVILETYRECLQDVFDLPALKRLLHGIQTRELDLVDVETASASPYSTSLLFDYIATYMYEDDTPPAERRAQALSLDRDLLRELLGQEELRDLLDAGAVEDVELQLRGTPKNADGLHDQLRLRGDLREGEYDEGFAQTLLRERRALLVRMAGEERLIAAEDAGRYRDAVGVMPPGGLPEVFLEGGAESLEELVSRYARGRGPFTTAQANERFGRDVEPLLHALERREKLVRGELRPGGTEREWCDPDVLRRLRRASLAALRKEVEPAEQAAFGRFLPHWHGIDRRATLREALVPLQGLSLPVSLWEAEVLPRRIPGFNAGQLDGSVHRASSSGSERVSTVSPCTSAKTHLRSAVPPLPRDPKASSTTSCARFSGPARSSGTTSSTQRDSSPRSRCPRCGISSGRARSRTTRGRRCAQAAATRRRSRNEDARAASHASAPPASPRRRDAGRSRTSSSPADPTRARSPSSCSNGRASSRATACAAKGYPAGTAPCTASSARSRRSAFAAAVTSSKASAARSSRCRARSNGCASFGRARTKSRRRSFACRGSRAAVRRRHCRGRSAPAHARRASRARRSFCSAASRRSSSSVVDARSCRSAIPRTAGCASRLRRSSITSSAAAPRSAWQSSASTASPSARARSCRCCSRPAFSPDRAARCFGPRPVGRAIRRTAHGDTSPARMRAGS